MGAFSSLTDRAVHVTGEADGVGTTIDTTAVREEAIYVRISGAPSILAVMDVKAISDLDFTAVMDTVEPSTTSHLTAFVFGNFRRKEEPAAKAARGRWAGLARQEPPEERRQPNAQSARVAGERVDQHEPFDQIGMP